MGAPHLLPTAATPIERILSRFDRQQIADFIEIAISLLDVANDPDLEDDDTAEDADASEDDDPAEEDNEDRCIAGDDGIGSGPICYGALGFPVWSQAGRPGTLGDEDAEPSLAPLSLNPDRGGRD